MNDLNSPGDADFLLVNEESWFSRHRPLALVGLAILALVVVGTIWEISSASSSTASSSSGPLLGSTTESTTDSTAATTGAGAQPTLPAHGPAVVTVTVHPPPQTVVQTETVTVTPRPADTRVVPDLIDAKLYETQAEGLLESMGLRVNVISDPRPAGAPDTFQGLVFEQDTAPGSVVPAGAVVTVHDYS